MCAMNPRLLRPLTNERYRALRVGLVAYWPLNETATSGDVTAEDYTKNGNNLTSNNSVLSTAGLFGNGREFVAANTEFLSIASNAQMQFGQKDWSMSFWFNIDAWGTYQMASKDGGGGREVECLAQTVSGSRVVQLVFYHSGGSVAGNIGSNLATGVWHFLALRHINSTGIITSRINGTANTFTRPSGQTWNSGTTIFTLGARQFPGFQQYMNGKIDECARWDRALSDAELDTLYNSGSGIDLRK